MNSTGLHFLSGSAVHLWRGEGWLRSTNTVYGQRRSRSAVVIGHLTLSSSPSSNYRVELFIVLRWTLKKQEQDKGRYWKQHMHSSKKVPEGIKSNSQSAFTANYHLQTWWASWLGTVLAGSPPIERFNVQQTNSVDYPHRLQDKISQEMVGSGNTMQKPCRWRRSLH